MKPAFASSRRKPASRVKANESTHLYATRPASKEGAEVVAALQTLGEAARQAEDRIVIELGMSPGDVLAVRYLLQADRDGQHLSPTDLSTLLGVTTAAASKLVDRLVLAGHAERRPHPTDRRARVIAPTESAAADMHASYAPIHAPLVSVVDALSPDEAAVIARFANTLAAALSAAPAVP